MADTKASEATLDKSSSKTVTDRREFLKSLPWLGIAWGSFVAAVTGVLVGTLRFLYPNVLYEPPQQFKAGFPEDYQVGEVATQLKDRYGIWLIRNDQGFYALIAVCTHLGCTPNWLSTENKFKCPCHGSGFYKTGINFEGPAPRPLERAAISLSEDGQILVDKSRKFLYERGGWDDPNSFFVYGA
ncbi:MAG: ubiquinol-cytochrome c reductase iron-sulfur subunit [Acidobacteriota bacterium]